MGAGSVKENVIVRKSFAFSVRIVNLHRYLSQQKKEYVISKQIYRSGTSIGANIAEAQRAQSTADFVAKMKIALKEANETQYWLQLLYETNYITEKEFNSVHGDLVEILKILTAICKHYPQSTEQNTVPNSARLTSAQEPRSAAGYRSRETWAHLFSLT